MISPNLCFQQLGVQPHDFHGTWPSLAFRPGPSCGNAALPIAFTRMLLTTTTFLQEAGASSNGFSDALGEGLHCLQALLRRCCIGQRLDQCAAHNDPFRSPLHDLLCLHGTLAAVYGCLTAQIPAPHQRAAHNAASLCSTLHNLHRLGCAATAPNGCYSSAISRHSCSG